MNHKESALAAIRTHQYDTAEQLIRELEAGATSRRASHEASTLLAVLRVKQGKIGAAIAACDQALRKEPQSREAALNLVTLLCDIGHYAEAFEIWGKHFGENARLDGGAKGRNHIAHEHLRLGKTYGALGLGHDALTQYHRAIQIDPNCVEAMVTLGRAYLKEGEIHAAVDSLAKAVETAPDDIESRVWYGIALLRDGRKGDAKHHWQRALSIDPQNRLALTYARIAEATSPGPRET